MRTKVLVSVGLVVSAALGYSLHVPDPTAVQALYRDSDPSLDRLRWHLERAESVYAVVFTSRRPNGEGTDICFRYTLEGAQDLRRELLEDPSGRYADVRIFLVSRR